MKYTTVINTKLNKTQEIPIIVIIDPANPRISHLALYYCKMLINQGKTLSTIRGITNNLKHLYDYYFYTNHNKASLLEDYAKAFRKQDILDWNLSDNRIKRHELVMREFCLWVSKHTHLANKEELQFANLIKSSVNLLNKLGDSILFHPDKIKHSFKHQNNNQVVKSFPIDKLTELIKTAPNPRDKIIFLLLAFGGRRISEILHLLTDDFNLIDNQLSVTLADPEKSFIKHKGKEITRTEYLKLFNLKPRNRVIGNDHIGWLSLKYQRPESHSSEIIFISNIEDYLLTLHIEYMKWRKQFKDHPFYLCKHNGKPLTRNSVYKMLDRAFKRINFDKAYLDKGLSFYSLRHFYGYYSSQALKLDPIIVQRIMGLTDFIYTNKYLVNKEESFLQIDKIKGGENEHRRISRHSK